MIAAIAALLVIVAEPTGPRSARQAWRIVSAVGPWGRPWGRPWGVTEAPAAEGRPWGALRPPWMKQALGRSSRTGMRLLLRMRDLAGGMMEAAGRQELPGPWALQSGQVAGSVPDDAMGPEVAMWVALRRRDG